MSERNEFDDLARRKLEERETAFREADWLDVQRLIEAQRPNRAWRTWLMVGAGAVMLGTAAWWMMDGNGTASSQYVQENVTNNAPGATAPRAVAPSIAPSSTIASTPVDASTSAVASTQPAPSASSVVGAERSSVQRTASNTALASHTTRSVPKATVHINQPPAQRIVAADPVVDPQTVVEPSDPTEILSSRINEEGGSNAEPASQTSTSATNTSGNTTNPAEPSLVAEIPASDPPLIVPAIVGTQVATSHDTEAGTEANNVKPASMSEVTTGTPPSGAETQTSGVVISETQENTEGQEPAAENITPADAPVVLARSTQADSAASVQIAATITSGQGTQVQDSATVAMPAPPPPLIKPDSPWEISALLGGLLSTSAYSGSNSAEWKSGVKGQWTPAFGAELMHMGRNFGIGSGIHYSTFQEELTVEERSLTTTVISDSNYFQPFHTSVLYVLGNVQINGQTFYVTESRDTTINILILGTSTSTTTRQLIDALHVVNRVSYMEIPLLLDGHLVQGAWALGLRGGPTIGVLTGRSGMTPNSTFDGYTPYTTEQFRTPVFGFTARAYLRYRFVNGWSVGLEPTWRGQFGNALSGDLVRKNSAIGGMLSVSYRLK